MLIIFPSDYFNSKQVDSAYTAEYEAVCKIPEFQVVLFDYDRFVAGESIKLYPKDYYTGDCIYRGWMLTPTQYGDLYTYLRERSITLINTCYQYTLCHCFPVVYPEIKQYTPKILSYPQGTDIDWDSVNAAFTRFMVKDYVKSEKGTTFPSFYTTSVDPATMDKRIAEFKEMRGSLFTGGIVLKEYVDLKKYGERTNEYRAFYLDGQVLSLCRNSCQPENCTFVPLDFVSKFSNLQSRYYTVDFAELADGSWIVLETGDGQVSGLSPNQWEFKYYDDIRGILLARQSCIGFDIDSRL